MTVLASLFPINAQKVAIIGSRDYADLDRVRAFVETLPSNTIVVSGGARGVDRTAAEAARKRKLQVIEHLPDWDRYGRFMAPKVRNQQIADDAEVAVTFWDGRSPGTRDAIERFEALGKTVIQL